MKKLSIICVLLSSLLLSGCGTVIGVLGFTGTIAEVLNLASITSSVYDAGAVVLDAKTTSDHAISIVMNEDCRMIRLLKNKQICQTKSASITRDYWEPALYVETPTIW